MELEKMLRRVHANSANLFHGRSPLSEICNDLILAQSMPSGAVHTIIGRRAHSSAGLRLSAKAHSPAATGSVVNKDRGPYRAVGRTPGRTPDRSAENPDHRR